MFLDPTAMIRRTAILLAAVLLWATTTPQAWAAPYASLVMDARNGEVILAENASARLHPASLTKMMTLYIAFEAVKTGQASMDDMVLISENAASEPPSKLGLKTGQEISLRNLVRAAAVMSANDAATAIAEHIEGNEADFVVRMNRTARAMGMSRTTFRNAHGLTEDGHLSTAYDMTLLGRQLFFDYPEYFNLFSRLTADAGVREVSHTNRAFLSSYQGADGIKTGYTAASGYNLTASAHRGAKHIIATVFGGKSTSERNETISELMDFGFRAARDRVALSPPEPMPWMTHPSGPTILAEEGGIKPTALGVSFSDFLTRRTLEAADISIIPEIPQAQPSANTTRAPVMETTAMEAGLIDRAAPRRVPQPAPVNRLQPPAMLPSAPAAPPFRSVVIPDTEIVFLFRENPAAPGTRTAPRWSRPTSARPKSYAMLHVGSFSSANAASQALARVKGQVGAALATAGEAIFPGTMGHDAYFLNLEIAQAEMICTGLRRAGQVCTVSRQ